MRKALPIFVVAVIGIGIAHQAFARECGRVERDLVCKDTECRSHQIWIDVYVSGSGVSLEPMGSSSSPTVLEACDFSKEHFVNVLLPGGQIDRETQTQLESLTGYLRARDVRFGVSIYEEEPT